MQEFRRHIEQITPVTDEEFVYIMNHFTRRSLRKHQYLLQAGDAVRNDHWVIRGCLKAYYADASGKNHIMQFATEDWWISDYGAHFRQEAAKLDIDCIEDSEVLCLSLHNREKLCAEMHKMEHFFRRKVHSGYAALQKRISSLLAGSARERYEEFIQLYPKLSERIPRKHIAAYLGVSRETLSRIYTNQ